MKWLYQILFFGGSNVSGSKESRPFRSARKTVEWGCRSCTRASIAWIDGQCQSVTFQPLRGKFSGMFASAEGQATKPSWLHYDRYAVNLRAASDTLLSHRPALVVSRSPRRARLDQGSGPQKLAAVALPPCPAPTRSHAQLRSLLASQRSCGDLARSPPALCLFLFANDLEVDFPSGNAVELLAGEEAQLTNCCKECSDQTYQPQRHIQRHRCGCAFGTPSRLPLTPTPHSAQIYRERVLPYR